MNFVIQVYEGVKAHEAGLILKRFGVNISERFDSWGHTGSFGADMATEPVYTLDTFFLCDAPNTLDLKKLRIAMRGQEIEAKRTTGWDESDEIYIDRVADIDFIYWDKAFLDRHRCPRITRLRRNQ